jgi:phosphotransferase system HPr-like phosphotransfer protein
MSQLNDIELSLIKEFMEELKRRGCKVEHFGAEVATIEEIGSKAKLPRTIQTESFKTNDKMIMHIAESYRRIAVKVHRDQFGKKIAPDLFANFIPAKINETKIKILENSLHNIQSEYDTHIRLSDENAADADMLTFRAFISVPMHLLEMARWLVHFFERHESEQYSGIGTGDISRIVDKNIVLNIVSSFALFYSHRYMMLGKRMAEKIMSRYARIARITVAVPKPVGFHARPAYYITIVVEEHGTDAFLLIGDRKFDARSVLDILEAGGIAADMELETVEFEGDERTLADLKLLADSNYCENEQIPKDLNYIRIARNVVA